MFFSHNITVTVSKIWRLNSLRGFGFRKNGSEVLDWSFIFRKPRVVSIVIASIILSFNFSITLKVKNGFALVRKVPIGIVDKPDSLG